jgi:hypothetical protein
MAFIAGEKRRADQNQKTPKTTPSWHGNVTTNEI